MGEDDVKSRREMLKAAGTLAIGAAAVSLLPASEASTSKEKIPRWAFIVDLRRCVGCRACTIACKAEFNVPLGRWRAVVKEVHSGRYPDAKKHFLPRLCNHCTGEKKKGRRDAVPPCVEKCPETKSGKRAKLGEKRYRTGATYKRPDGMILVDNSLCIGCGRCIKACPYGVRFFDPHVKLKREDREADFGIGKCDFCVHRVDKGVEPSCVNTCPGNARIFGDLNDPNSRVSKLVKEFNLTKNLNKTTLSPEEKTMPQVFYIDPDEALKAYTIDKDKKEAEYIDQIV